MCDLNPEDLELFDKLYKLLDDVEDVTEIYHNVNGRDQNREIYSFF